MSPIELRVCTNLAISAALMIFMFMSKPLSIIVLIATLVGVECGIDSLDKPR